MLTEATWKIVTVSSLVTAHQGNLEPTSLEVSVRLGSVHLPSDNSGFHLVIFRED